MMALFRYEDDFIAAATKLKESGFDRMCLMSPIAVHEVQKVAGLGKSQVRRFSLIGAILGGGSPVLRWQRSVPWFLFYRLVDVQ